MNRTILIADDDPAVRALVSGYLTDPFTTCSEAVDGQAAVELAGRLQPDAIVLDMDMPRLDGFDACMSLKSNPSTRRIPILFLTSNGEVPDKVRGLDLGAVDYITKPFEGEELKARVRSVFRSQRELRRADDRVARDEATGLFNRAYLLQRIEADLAASRRHHQPLACCVAALARGDGAAGQPRARGVGPEDMRRAAAGVLSVLRREDVACRYDDDSIAVLAYTPNQPAALALGHRVHAAVTAAFAAADGKPPTVNVGVALSHYSVGDSLLFHATEATRNAKLNAPGTVQFGGELTEFQLVEGSYPN